MLAITTLPGAILLHEGQTEGYRVRTPVQLLVAAGKSPAISVCGVFTSVSCPCPISDRAILLCYTRARYVREMTRTKHFWHGHA